MLQELETISKKIDNFLENLPSWIIWTLFVLFVIGATALLSSCTPLKQL